MIDPGQDGREADRRTQFLAALMGRDNADSWGIPQSAGDRHFVLHRPGGETSFVLTSPTRQQLAQREPGVTLYDPSPGVIRSYAPAPDGAAIAVVVSDPKDEFGDLLIIDLGVRGAAIGHHRVSNIRLISGAPVWEADSSGFWIIAGRPGSQAIQRISRSGDPGLKECLRSDAHHGLYRARGAILRTESQQDGATVWVWESSSQEWARCGAISARAVVVTEHGCSGPSATRRDDVAVRLWESSDQDRGQSCELGPEQSITVPGTGALTRAVLFAANSVIVHRVAFDGERLDRVLITGGPPKELWRSHPAEHVHGFSSAAAGSLWVLTSTPTQAQRLVNTADSNQRVDKTGMTITTEYATSADGTRVPMTVVSAVGSQARKAGEPRPVLVTCYGGFGIVNRVESSPSVAAWLDAGGVYIATHVRGGGELGPSWHKDGVGAHKHRSIDDLAACLRQIVSRGMAKASHITVVGASHGGFLALATMLKHPELCGAVIATAPIVDTENLDAAGLGRLWRGEFDGSDSGSERRRISPRQLLDSQESAAHLPALLMILMDSDQRIDNAGARAFFDELRRKGGQASLRVIKNAGHAGFGREKAHQMSADILSFASRELIPFP